MLLNLIIIPLPFADPHQPFPTRTKSNDDDDLVLTFSCDLCREDEEEEANFESDEARIKHYNLVHAGKNGLDYQCYICLQYFRAKHVFNMHVGAHLKGQSCACISVYDDVLSYFYSAVKTRRHKCFICSKAFLKIQHLQAHLLVHTGAKPHACSACEKSYTTAYSLRSHYVNAHEKGNLLLIRLRTFAGLLHYLISTSIIVQA